MQVLNLHGPWQENVQAALVRFWSDFLFLLRRALGDSAVPYCTQLRVASRGVQAGPYAPRLTTQSGPSPSLVGLGQVSCFYSAEV